VKSNSTVKMYGPQEGHCEKRCEIQSGSQEMAVLMAIFNNDISSQVVLPFPHFISKRRQHKFT